MNKLTFQRCSHDCKNRYVKILRDVIQDPKISPKSIGFYAMYQAYRIEWDEIPIKSQNEILSYTKYEEVTQ